MDKRKEVALKIQKFRIGKIREATTKLELYSQLAEELGELAKATLVQSTIYSKMNEKHFKQSVGLFSSNLTHAIEEYTDVMTVLDVLDIPEQEDVLKPAMKPAADSVMMPATDVDTDGDANFVKSKLVGKYLWIQIANACLDAQHACFKMMRYLSGGYVSGELADFEASIMRGIIELKSVSNDSYLYKDSDLFAIKLNRWYNRLSSMGRISVVDDSEELEGGEEDGDAQVQEESD